MKDSVPWSQSDSESVSQSVSQSLRDATVALTSKIRKVTVLISFLTGR
jgi:hypothetical protein